MATGSVYPISLVVIFLLAISSCYEAGAATWSNQNGGWRVQEDNGREHWVGPNGREQKWGNVAPDKQVTSSSKYGWGPDSRFPPIDVEHTRKIPWADVGKRAGATVLKYGTRVLPWIGYGSIIISAGYDVCKIVDGEWCQTETVPDNQTTGNYSCGPYDGRYEQVSPGHIAYAESREDTTAWVCSPYGTLYHDTEGAKALLAQHPGFTINYRINNYSIYMVSNASGGNNTSITRQIPVDPSVVANAVDQSVSSGNNADQIAQSIATNSPADATSDLPLSDSYNGPSTVTGTPTKTISNTTNAQGEAVQTVTTTTPTMNISYGDNVTINEITNVTNTTTTTTHADGSTTTETEDKTDVECKNCGNITDPGAPETNYPENKEQDFGEYMNPIMNSGGGGECPPPYRVLAFGKTYEVSVEPFCKLATDVRPYFLTMMLLVSTMVAFGPSRRG